MDMEKERKRDKKRDREMKNWEVERNNDTVKTKRYLINCVNKLSVIISKLLEYKMNMDTKPVISSTCDAGQVEQRICYAAYIHLHM